MSCSRLILWPVLFIGIGCTMIAQATAQEKQYLHPAGIPTGTMAQFALLSGVSADYFQPIQINVPEGVEVGVAVEGDYLVEQTRPVFGFLPGNVYRLRLTNIPLRDGQELYPTLEPVNRLYPPEGLEFDFPVMIDLTKEDIDLALAGHLVTRFVYLERPDGAIPIDSSEASGKITLDIRDEADPIAIAESRGIIMAVIRMGSRIPTEAPNSASPFFFGLPPVMALPESR